MKQSTPINEKISNHMQYLLDRAGEKSGYFIERISQPGARSQVWGHAGEAMQGMVLARLAEQFLDRWYQPEQAEQVQLDLLGEAVDEAARHLRRLAGGGENYADPVRTAYQRRELAAVAEFLDSIEGLYKYLNQSDREA